MIRSTSFETISGIMGQDRRVAERGRPSIPKEEAAAIRREAKLLRSAYKSRKEFADAIGMTSTGAKYLLDGTNGPGEETARRIAELRQLPDGFWRKKPPGQNVTKPATERERVRWVADRLAIPEEDLLRIWAESAVRLAGGAPGDDRMKGLPIELRDAALALVHLADCTLEEATKAAHRALAEVGPKVDWKPKHWLAEVERLLVREKKSGSRPSARFRAADPGE